MNRSLEYGRELSQDEVLELINKEISKYIKHIRYQSEELVAINSKISEIEELENEISMIEKTVKMNLLSSFKIKRAMIPAEFKTIDKMKERKIELEDLRHKTLSKIVSIQTWISNNENTGLFSYQMLESLFSNSPLNKHLSIGVYQGEYNDKSIYIVPTSMLGNIVSSFTANEYTQGMRYWGEAPKKVNQTFDLKLIVSDVEVTRENIRSFLLSVIEDEGNDLNCRKLSKMYLRNVNSLTYDDLLSLSIELRKTLLMKTIPLYVDYLNKKDEDEGIDWKNEMPIETSLRRNESRARKNTRDKWLAELIEMNA